MDMIICHCKQVTEKEIVSYIKKNPHAGFNIIKADTRVSTGCGKCTTAVKILIEKTKKKLPPQLQLQIPFS
jgi:bacterioferritin-associated ferredoxin